jgi:hypothetical protein
LESASKIRFRPELALTHLRFGELEMADGHDVAALEHLVAIPEPRDMNMRPGLERALTLMEAVNSRAPGRSEPHFASDGLTARELEVVRLIGEGRSNRDIAETLLSPRARSRYTLNASSANSASSLDRKSQQSQHG